MDHTTITATRLAELDGLQDWRYLLTSIHAEFRAGTFAAAGELVSAVAAAADEVDHHPEIDVRFPDRVLVSLASHDAGGVTSRDVDLARRISDLAATRGATPDPSVRQQLEIAIDTTDADRIRPFWAAVLDYREHGDALVDPRRLGPPVWFQATDRPRTERGRFHLDVSVPHDVAEQRVAAALAAGGTLVTDQHARAWWVLADADGNEACVCTWQDR